MQANTFFISMFFLALAVFSARQNTYAQSQQDVIIDQKIVTTGTITNPDTIRKIVRISLLPEKADSINSITLIDANNNGFGSDDFVLVKPSGRSYELIPSAALTEMIKNWRFTAATQLVGGPQQGSEFLESLNEGDPKKKAANFILASMLRGLNNNYSAQPMNIYFRRSFNGAYTFDMWGYDVAEDSLYWQPPKYPPGGYIKNYDIFRVQRMDKDTLFISNTTLYDQIYIYHNVTDTVFIAPDSTIIGLQQFQPGLKSPKAKLRREDD
ncbi:MAG: hypothetical protein ACE5I1_27165 [bacterium]